VRSRHSSRSFPPSVAEVVRLLLWSLGDSKTTLDELREHLPSAVGQDVWISNDVAERFGLITYGGTPQSELARVRELIGKDPEVAEEFDVE
jgi:hypothetical protein